MALTYSWPGPTGLATTTDGRKALAGLVVRSTAGVARSGVFPAHANALVSARSDMNVDVAAFSAVGVQFGGPVLFSNDGTAQLDSVLVSPGSGTNFYVVYAKQNESVSPATDANTNRVLSAALSTVSFTAARGALPAGAVELATVQMPSGKTATNQSGVVITATYQFTAAAGGSVWFRSVAEMNADSSLPNGTNAFVVDTSAAYQRRSGAWATTADDSGWVTLTLSSGWSATSATHTPRIRKIGKQVFLAGGVTLNGGSYSNIAVVPSGYRITGSYTDLFLGGVVTSSGISHELFLSGTTHRIQVPDVYRDGVMSNGDHLPLVGTWFVD